MYAGYYRRPRRGRGDDRAGRPRGARPTQRAASLSGGQQRRLDVGVALIGDAELLFLDEPTTGFDPSARRRFWEVVAGLRDLGKTVFLTTHYMDEAQTLADRVAVIAAGKHRRRRHPGRDSGAGGRPDQRDQLRAAGAVRAAATSRPSARRGVPVGNGRLTMRDRRADGRAQRLTGWALERGIELDAARGPPAEPRGRLPGADGGPMSAAALALHQFRYDQRIFWRNPASVFFTVIFPVIFLFLFAGLFGNRDDRRRSASTRPPTTCPAIITLAVVSATLVSLGDEPRRRPRGRSAEALPRHAAAGLGVHRRPGRQLDRRRGDDGRSWSPRWGRSSSASRSRRTRCRRWS